MAKITTLYEFLQTATANDTEALLGKLREAGLPVEHSLFATIHRRSEERPEGFTEEDMDDIAASLHEHDRAKWIAALEAHKASQAGDGGSGG